MTNNSSSTSPNTESHSDDIAVDRFAMLMKSKLAAARAKGRGGWDDPARCNANYLRKSLHEHVAKGDPVDVANFCMMLAHYGASTATPDSPSECPECGDTSPLEECATCGSYPTRKAALDSGAGDAGEVFDLLRQALISQRAWHVEKAKALSKQPPTPANQWQRHEHLEQVDNAYTALNRVRQRLSAADTIATPTPAVDAQHGDDDGPCTDCEDTDITIQTERACSCEAGDQHRAPAVDAGPAGEFMWPDEDEFAAQTEQERLATLKAYYAHRAALSHGEGR